MGVYRIKVCHWHYKRSRENKDVFVWKILTDKQITLADTTDKQCVYVSMKIRWKGEREHWASFVLDIRQFLLGHKLYTITYN